MAWADARAKSSYQTEEERRHFLMSLMRQKSDRIAFVTPSNAKSAAWLSFKMITLDGVNQQFAICESCSKVLSCRRGTGSMLRHHCTQRVISEQHSGEPLSSTVGGASGTGLASNSDDNASTEGFVSPYDNKNKREVTVGYALLEHLVENMLPLHVADSENLRKLLRFSKGSGTVATGRSSVASSGLSGSSSEFSVPDSDTLLRDYLPSRVQRITHDAYAAILGGARCFSFNVIPFNSARLKDYLIGVYVHSGDTFRISSSAAGYFWWESGRDNVIDWLCDKLFHQLAPTFNLCDCYYVTNNVDLLRVAASEKASRCYLQMIDDVRRRFGNVLVDLCGDLFDTDAGNATVEQCTRWLRQLADDTRTNVTSSESGWIKQFWQTLNEAAESMGGGSSKQQRSKLAWSEPNLHMAVLWKHKLTRLCSGSSTPAPVSISDTNERLNTLRSTVGKMLNNAIKLTDIHYMALFLDPRFKALKMLDTATRQRVYQMIQKRCESNNAAALTSERADSPCESALSPPAATIVTKREPVSAIEMDRQAPLSKLQVDAMSSNVATSSTLSSSASGAATTSFRDLMDEVDISVTSPHINELTIYLNLKVSASTAIAQFWSQHRHTLPNLYTLAEQLLTLPASVVPSNSCNLLDTNPDLHQARIAQLATLPKEHIPHYVLLLDDLARNKTVLAKESDSSASSERAMVEQEVSADTSIFPDELRFKAELRDADDENNWPSETSSGAAAGAEDAAIGGDGDFDDFDLTSTAPKRTRTADYPIFPGFDIVSTESLPS